MQPPFQRSDAIRRRPGRWLRRFLWTALLLPVGCNFHNYWDNVTSRDLPWQDRLWPKTEEPLEIIQKSNDGAKRGKALATLRDPGNDERREVYLKILTATALDDAEPMCRLGAIRALGSYKDPRAVKVLENVYQQRLPFTPELTSVVRQQALASLEETGIPEAREQLILVAKQPSSQGSSQERQQIMDERLQAIRALRRFRQNDSADALIYVLETEKDVALRHRATESLQVMTGKSLPAEPVAWREALQRENIQTAREPSFIERVMWWKHD